MYICICVCVYICVCIYIYIYRDIYIIPSYVCILVKFTSLVAQMVKRLPTIWETWVRSLGGEDPLEKEMATHSSTLAWKIPWEEPGRLHGVAKSWTRLSDLTPLHFTLWNLQFWVCAQFLLYIENIMMHSVLSCSVSYLLNKIYPQN